MKKSKVIIPGILMLLVVILFLFAATQLNFQQEQQQKMEAGILHNNARDMFEDSVKLQKAAAQKVANYIRELKEQEEELRKWLMIESTP
jgi:hypothetical protein